MNTKIIITTALIFSLIACNHNKHQFDASGTFEVDEVIVSSEIPGKILSFNIREGDTIPKNKIVGEIDAENLSLQKEQVQASIQALGEKKTDVLPGVYLLLCYTNLFFGNIYLCIDIIYLFPGCCILLQQIFKSYFFM